LTFLSFRQTPSAGPRFFSGPRGWTAVHPFIHLELNPLLKPRIANVAPLAGLLFFDPRPACGSRASATPLPPALPFQAFFHVQRGLLPPRSVLKIHFFFILLFGTDFFCLPIFKLFAIFFCELSAPLGRSLSLAL